MNNRTSFEVQELPVSGTHGRQFDFVERWEDGTATVTRIREDGNHYMSELPGNGVLLVSASEDFETLLANARRGELTLYTEGIAD